jgi:hypothetical protein
MFSKAGGTAGKNCFSTRACIPVRWLNEMGINPNDRNIIISFDGEKMIIEKRN